METLKNNIFYLLMFVIIYPVIHLIISRWLGFQNSEYLYIYYMFVLPLLLILFPFFNYFLNPNNKARKFLGRVSIILFLAWFGFMFYLVVTGEFV
jgi:hypothetical protein